MKTKNTFYLFVLLAIGVGCQNTNQESQPSNPEIEIESPKEELSAEDVEKVSILINSIAPPLEMSYIMQDMELNFSPSILYSDENVELYDNSLDKASIMGIMGSDMVYCLVHNRNDLVSSYIESMQLISNDLNLSEVLDFKKMRTLAEKEMDANQLALEYTSQMEKVFNHLKENNQLDISAMLAFGGWVESMYIASETGIDMNEFSEDVVDLVYYETTMSNSFLDIFSRFDHVKKKGSLYSDLEKLRDLYKNFEVQIEKIEPQVVQNSEMTQVVDLTTQTLKFEDEDVEVLVSQIKQLRNSLLINP